MSENNQKFNLLILGQRGVGKSSLINALVGHEVEITGTGKPIAARGIFPYETSIDGKDVVIYNSYGLEVDKIEEWERIIRNELYIRCNDIKDRFHSVTYCIQAGGFKIQYFDIKIIKQFIENQYDVVIALTKADQIEESLRKEFIDIIKEETGVEQVIPIAASPDKLRGMTETPSPLGLDDYQIAVLESWKQMFIERVPIYISEKIKNDLENKRYELINKYKKYNLNDNVLKSSITEEIEQFFKDEILLYIKDTIKAYYNIQIDIVSLNSGMLINNARYNFHQYSFYKDNFFNMDFENIFDLLFNIGFFKFLFTLGIFLPFIGLPLAIVGGIFTIFGGKIKEAQREKFINELIDKLKYQIVGKDYILNIKNAIIKCLEETDKKLSEYSQN